MAFSYVLTAQDRETTEITVQGSSNAVSTFAARLPETGVDFVGGPYDTILNSVFRDHVAYEVFIAISDVQALHDNGTSNFEFAPASSHEEGMFAVALHSPDPTIVRQFFYELEDQYPMLPFTMPSWNVLSVPVTSWVAIWRALLCYAQNVNTQTY
jgi:hypothetical protein